MITPQQLAEQLRQRFIETGTPVAIMESFVNELELQLMAHGHMILIIRKRDKGWDLAWAFPIKFKEGP